MLVPGPGSNPIDSEGVRLQIPEAVGWAPLSERQGPEPRVHPNDIMSSKARHARYSENIPTVGIPTIWVETPLGRGSCNMHLLNAIFVMADGSSGSECNLKDNRIYVPSLNELLIMVNQDLSTYSSKKSIRKSPKPLARAEDFHI